MLRRDIHEIVTMRLAPLIVSLLFALLVSSGVVNFINSYLHPPYRTTPVT